MPVVRWRPIVGLVGLAVVACPKAVPRQSEFMTSTQVEMSGGELRTRTYATGRALALGIEATADSVLASTHDPEVRRHALLWKASAVPSVQEATLARDPLVAAMDLYAFMLQMHTYFDRGDGAQLFGDEQPIISDRLPGLVTAAREFARKVAGDNNVAVGDSEIVQWAAAHPVRGANYRRESLVGTWAEAFGSRGTGAVATLGHMDQSVEEISERLRFINETILKQVRWNAQLLASDLVRPEEVDAARALLSGAAALSQGLPDRLTEQREAVFTAVDRERLATLREVDRQREATMAEVLAVVHAERIATLASVDSMVRRMMRDSASVIDHVFWRLVQLVITMFAVTGVLAFVMLRYWNEHRRRTT